MENIPIIQDNHKERAQQYFTDSPGSAEIGRLGAKLDSMKNGRQRQFILITSSVSGEGKSTIASLLARSKALHHQKTLLVDFDIRRPKLDTIFNVPKKNGLVDILRSELPLNLCIKRTHIPNLTLITSGFLTGNPVEVLNSERIKLFFESIGEHCDEIIIDSPPAIPVSDPLILSKFVDNVILVVKAGSTSKFVVRRAINMFNDINVKLSGIILNNMANVLPYYYDHKSYGYQYYEYEKY
jgi:capsular exopolysaccharide synthesis family protein